jgi:hypothetical protein
MGTIYPELDLPVAPEEVWAVLRDVGAATPTRSGDGPHLRRRHRPEVVAARCFVGLTPRTRLKAELRAKALP